jgi:outer membrane murein-binding lipoprotein Lpp
MNNKVISAAVVAALLSAAQIPAAQAQSSDLEQLKAQLQALQAKVEELEKQQKAQGEATDRATDAVAQTRSNVGEWVGRFTWKGDFRYRNEDIKQEFNPRERNRDRIRVRAGFVAKVNDTVRAEVQLSTGESLSSGGYGDARSPNQTLTDASSRKRVWFDTAFAEWAPNPNWKVTFGKMRYPWVRPTGVLFFDNDINPEGGAINWQQGTDGLFATAFYVNLAERAALADSTMSGAQIGWRSSFGSATRLTLAASYFDHGAVEGYNAVQDAALPGNAFGNTTTTSAAICRPGVINGTSTACIANDFNVVEVLGELTTQLWGKPFTFVADYAKNNKANFTGGPTSPSGLDTAYAAGFQVGRVTTANTWELGYLYQKIENDALYGQWVDSDFGGGSTGSKGHVFKAGYGFGKNFRINGTYFLNDTNIAVPFTVSGAPRFDRAYRRYQLDLNVTF